MKGLLWQPGRLGPVELRNRSYPLGHQRAPVPAGRPADPGVGGDPGGAGPERGGAGHHRPPVCGPHPAGGRGAAGAGRPDRPGPAGPGGGGGPPGRRAHRRPAQPQREEGPGGGQTAGRPRPPEDFSREELDRLAEQFRLGVQLCREAGLRRGADPHRPRVTCCPISSTPRKISARTSTAAAWRTASASWAASSRRPGRRAGRRWPCW